MGFLAETSQALAFPEDGMRLLISVLAGYPLAAIYRQFLYDKNKTIQYSYFTIVGIGIYLFNCGYETYHSMISVLLAYVICNFLPGTTLSVVLAHICFLGHLLIGYWFAESHEYDITWTTPFCIMTLRHIGLVMDVYDGKKRQDSLRPDQKATSVVNPPSLLETAAFSLFFSGTLVGPQFTLNRFRRFVNGEFLDPETKQPRASALRVSICRFLAGIFYAVIHQWGCVWIPQEYLNSAEFYALPFLWKCIWIMIWFRLTMARYCAAWLLTEGAAILCGLGYNGLDERKREKWDGVRDLHITGWELGSDFQSVINSFNVGTNTFAKNHIFRRLQWLGSKTMSHVVTLIYLATWHGYHLGYFVLFIYEFAAVFAQDQLYALIKRTPGAREFLDKPYVRPFTWLFGRLTITMTMAFGFLSFGLIKKEKWIGPVSSMYFSGWIWWFIGWPVLHQILLRTLPRKPREAHVEKEKKTE